MARSVPSYGPLRKAWRALTCAPLRCAHDGRLPSASDPAPICLIHYQAYTTKTLAIELGRPTNWVATAAKVLRLKERRENAYGVPGPGGGRVVQWRYSDHALRLLEEKIAGDPHWNPYHLLS